MKTKITFVLAIILGVILGASHAFATVGGPSYIGFFKYNKADESVYYIESSMSGRGCPPELRKISLTTSVVSTVFDCNQGEALRGDDYQNGGPVMNEISKITQGFKDLTPINLLKNNIQIDVNFVKKENLDGEPDFVIRTHFLAKVFQNGKLIQEFPIVGCNMEQPFTFAGYAIPGFEKKIVLLSSTKSDCWEGGYTGESLYVIANVNGVDKDTYYNTYKSHTEPLVPSEATLVVFEKDTVVAATNDPATATTTEKSGLSTGLTILVAVVALIAGLLFGRKYNK